MKNSHLKYLINEDIFVIDESDTTIESKSVDQPAEVVNEAKPQADPEQPEAISFDGNPDSPVLILYKNAGEGLESNQKTFLENILKAVNLQLSHVSLYNFEQSKFTLDDIMKNSQAKIVLAFGLSDLESFQAIPTDTIHKEEQYEIFNTDNLTAIANDTAKKKILWGNLQQLFLK